MRDRDVLCLLQLANASYVWLPLLPRQEDPSLYHIVYRQSWSPSEYCNETPTGPAAIQLAT